MSNVFGKTYEDIFFSLDLSNGDDVTDCRTQKINESCHLLDIQACLKL